MSFQEEAQLWRERYRVLFGENVAGVILTTPAGRIIDCNEACARIFGFDSKETMLAHSDAWDFYFNRAEREILIDRLRTPGNSSADEVCLRARDGGPIWVIARRTVELCGRCSRAATRHVHRHHRPEESSGTAAGHHRRTVIGRDAGWRKRWDQWLVPTDSEYFTACE